MSRYIIDYNLKNGLGNPSVNLYLKGCDKPSKCEGCHNWEMQEESKEDYDIDTIIQELDSYIRQYLTFHKQLYVCILGGEPLAEYNKPITTRVSKYIKKEYPSSKVILYSWKEPRYLPYIDYGILGEYKEDGHVDNVIPSSANQYIYDFNNQIKLNNIKLKG